MHPAAAAAYSIRGESGGAGRGRGGAGLSRSCLERCLGRRRIPRVGKAQLKGADGATPPAGHSVDVNQLISDVSKQRRRSSSETMAATLRLCVSGVREREREKKSAAPNVRERPPLKAVDPLGGQSQLLSGAAAW